MKAAQKNFCEMMLCPDHETPFEEVAALAECLDENGRFPDFERMVRLLSNRQVLENDKLRSRAMRGMDFWLRADLRNPNWWHNQIGQPRYMGMAALLLKSWLTDEQRELAWNHGGARQRADGFGERSRCDKSRSMPFASCAGKGAASRY